VSFVPILYYGLGLAVFGFVYYILDGLLEEFILVGVHETGSTYDLLIYFWAGILLVYLLFGGWWAVRKYAEKHEYGGLV